MAVDYDDIPVLSKDTQIYRLKKDVQSLESQIKAKDERIAELYADLECVMEITASSDIHAFVADVLSIKEAE